jgi:cytochrome c556
MKYFSKTVLLFVLVGIFPIASADENDFPFSSQINARQSGMTLYGYNLGLLGSMAKGTTPYDAKIATEAAHNLLSISAMKNSTIWPVGSDIDAPGLANKTAAKANIWSSFPEIGEKHQALTESLTKMSLVAGDGVEAIRANIGSVGKACKACHEQFRQEDEN